MNANVRPTDLALQRSLADVVAEYDTKRAALAEAEAAFKRAGDELKMASIVGGTFGNVTLNVGHVNTREMEESLLKSAWLHVHAGLNIDRLSSPTDKRLWKQALEKPVPFTIDNIRGTFGNYIQNPRGNILRGLAEVFCGLDDCFKSHDKMKIGVAGLPKRIIMGGFGRYSDYGRDKVQSILNALASYQGKPLVEMTEVLALLDNENALLKPGELKKYDGTMVAHPARGVRLRRFENGNGHLFFEKDTLVAINKALAEFYGEVLPDTPDENPQRPQSTAVSKDLQYYPTPQKIVDDLLDGLRLDGANVLEPSCGCGRFLDALRKRGANPYGIEADFGRAAQSRAKGHAVLHANFLETIPSGDFDFVVMNPPFYGKHYAKHVRHAFDFLKPGGTLISILPVTAREHGLLDDLIGKPKYHWDRCSAWRDLPVGSFTESGTNINTTVLRLRKPE